MKYLGCVPEPGALKRGTATGTQDNALLLKNSSGVLKKEKYTTVCFLVGDCTAKHHDKEFKQRKANIKALRHPGTTLQTLANTFKKLSAKN